MIGQPGRPLIGVDSSKLPGSDAPTRTVHELLDLAAGLGFEAVLVRSVLDLHPRLDPAALEDVRAHAAALGLRLEAGVGKVNPYMTAEMPEVRSLGDGDYVAGMTRMIDACARIGITEAWTATGFWKREYRGRWQYDRFRTDAPWSDQLAATTRLVKLLRPALAGAGVHLNLETHEEITTHEVLRIVEEVGADVLGVTFDVANVVVRGEDPLAAARRCHGAIRMTHLRDFVLVATPTGFDRYVVPIGEGVLDWPALLEAIGPAAGTALTIEGWEASGLRSRKPVDVYDPAWVAGHPDLDPVEVDALTALVRSPAEVGDLDSPGDPLDFLRRSRAALAALLGRAG